MNTYNKAFNSIIRCEGGYVNDKDDRGGETYIGISRRHNPNWIGWAIIDKAKEDSAHFPKNLNNTSGLKEAVKAIYADKYWNTICGDSLPEPIAFLLFNISVVFGTITSSKMLQRAMNLLNRDEHYDDLMVDGIIGRKSLEAVTILNDKESIGNVLKVLLTQMGNRFVSIVEKDISQRKYIRGWLNRIYKLSAEDAISDYFV